MAAASHSAVEAAGAATAFSTSPAPVQGAEALVHSSSEKGSSLNKAESDVADDNESERSVPLKIIPWSYKGWVLALVICFEMAAYWNTGLSSIKSIIKKDLDINNAQYGVISSASSLINTIIPFITGVLLDYYGAEVCVPIASLLVFLGYLIAAAGATAKSYPAIVVGEVIAGFGDITVRTGQLKISAHWFRGTNLGVALALAISVQRTIGVVAKSTAVPMSEKGGFHWFFWVAFILQAICFALTIIYYFYERSVPQEYRAPRGRDVHHAATTRAERRATSLKHSMRRFWNSVLTLPMFFWFLLITQLLQNGVVIAFQTLNADMYRVIRGVSATKAGWISGVGQIPVIILTFLCGLFFDKIGFRVHFIALSAILWIMVFCLLAYSDLSSIGITFLQSIPYAINLVPLQAVIAMTVSPTQQGSAQGAYQVLVNPGTVIVNVAAGAIQDGSPKGKHNYDRVLVFLLAIKAWDVVAGALYCILDWTSLNKILSRSYKQQRAYDDKVAAGEVVKPATPWLKSKNWVTRTALAIMFGQTVAAWVVYLKYSV
ncbi:hypothetical protein JCM8097_007474 [Rhodosporidiobolus ruineniae]